MAIAVRTETPEDAPKVTGPRSVVRWLVDELIWIARVFISSGDRFYWDNGFSRAASLAYTTLFSVVPASAFMFAFLASLSIQGDHLPRLQEFLFRQFLPDSASTDQVVEYLSRFSSTVMSASPLVAAAVLITLILLINSVESVLNEIWQVYEPRTVAQRVAIFCAIIVIGPIMAFSGYWFITSRITPLIDELSGVNLYVTQVYRYLMPILIDCVAFVSLYHLVPKAPVRFRSAIFGGFIAAVLFSGTKWAFAVYIEEFSSYNQIYGALGAVPVFLFWLYLLWVIVVFGAELCYQAQHLPRFGALQRRSVRSVGDSALVLAVQALTMVASAFLNGRRLPNDLEIAEALGCSSVVLRPTLAALEKAGIIAHGDSREMPVILLRTPESISLSEIQRAVLGTRAAVQYPEVLCRLFGELKEKGSTLSLAGLVK